MQRIRWVTREYFPSERFAGCVSVARNKIPSCGSRVLNTFVFLHQRCTWPAPVIPQVFGTSVSDKSPAPGRLSRPFLSPAIFSRHFERTTVSSTPFVRPRSPSFLPSFLSFLSSFSFFLFFSPLCTFYAIHITHRFIGESLERKTIRRTRSIYECWTIVTTRPVQTTTTSIERKKKGRAWQDVTTHTRIQSLKPWYSSVMVPTTYRQRNARNRPMTDRRWPMGTAHKTYYPPFTARW